MKSITFTHRLLAVLLLVTLVLSLYFGLVQTLMETHRSYTDRLDQGDLRLAKLQQLMQSRETIEYELKKVKLAGISQEYLLRGRTPGLAAAALQKQLKSIVESSDIQLISVRMLPHAVEKDFIRVSATARLRTYTNNLQEVIYAIETGIPLLFINRLSVRSRARARNIGGTSASTAALLDIDIELSGYARTSSGKVDSA